MKDIIYIITGCLIFGICTIKAVDTITPNELSKAQVKLERNLCVVQVNTKYTLLYRGDRGDE